MSSMVTPGASLRDSRVLWSQPSTASMVQSMVLQDKHVIKGALWSCKRVMVVVGPGPQWNQPPTHTLKKDI